MDDRWFRPGDHGRYVAMRNYFNIVVSTVVLLTLAGCNNSTTRELPAPTAEPVVVAREVTVAHEGVRMKLRRKTLSNTKAKSSNTLVLLPSATYSTSPNWDLQYKDNSLMEFFAESGWVVYAIDLPGYGKSDNPPNPETFGAIETANYINAAVDYICEQHQIKSINLLGWSWGAQAAGRYANQYPKRVNKLVLYGFTYKMRLPQNVLPKEPFRKIDFEGAMSDFIDGCYEDDLPEEYANAVLDADSDRLAPAGPIHDFVNRLPIVQPTQLPMSVLVLCGQYELEQPPDMDGDYSEHFLARRNDLDAFCRQLPLGKDKLAVVDGGGHAVHLERPKDLWRKIVLEFFQTE